MAEGRELVIKKVSAGKLAALYRSFIWLINHWEVASDHDELLLHHAFYFRDKFEKMAMSEKPKTIKLNEMECTAFWQLWKGVNFDMMKYEGLILQEAFNDVHKFRTNGKAYEDSG